MLNYIYLYLFLAPIFLIRLTKPEFGFDPLYSKQLRKAAKLGQNVTKGGIFSILEMIGVEKQELYFYGGLFLMFCILLLLFMYYRVDKCLETYKQKKEKYATYSTLDFFTNFELDVLNDVFKKSIGLVIPPFILTGLITIVILVVNLGAKVPFLKWLALFTAIFNYGMYLVLPAIIIAICSIFIGIDALVPC
jgi:membrane-associated HD superfamily phosphohydrolase